MPEFHEAPVSHDEREPPSIRGFAITFAAVFSFIGLFPVIFHGGAAPHWWAFAIAAGFLAAGFLAPQLLAPLNRLWFRFGMLLHHIVNPVVLGLLFLVVIAPTALIMRLCGKRPIPMKGDPAVESYWVHRDPPGPAPESMRNQF